MSGIGPASAAAILRALQAATAEAYAQAVPDLDGGTAQDALLPALHRTLAIREAYQVYERNSALVGHLRLAVKDGQQLPLGLRWGIAGKEWTAQALRLHRELLPLLSSQAASELQEAADRAEREASPREALQGFSANRRVYAALLRETVPGARLKVQPDGVVAGKQGGRHQQSPVDRVGSSSSGSARRLGPYTLQKKLGSGAFGTTYLATDDRGAQVAVKVLSPGALSDPGKRATLEQEVRAGQRINSRYFARVLDFDTAGATPWIAQQYVPGQSLGQLISAEAPLTATRAMAIAEQLLSALEDLQRYGVVHHDIKPDNIQVGANDTITLLDLGVSWTPGDGGFGGTPAYLPPECFADNYRPDPATDTWAAGVIIAEIATGHHPVLGAERDPRSADGQARLRRKLESGLADLSGMPAELLDVVRSMVRQDPGDRPPAAQLRPRLRHTDAGHDGATEQAWVDGLTLLLQMSETRGIGMTIQFDDDVYLQWEPSGDHLQLELVGNKYLPAERKLNPDRQQRMKEMGFVVPSRRNANWWCQVSNIQGDFTFHRAARIVIRALLEVYELDPEVFDREFGQALIDVRDDPDQWLRIEAGLQAPPAA